jgi:hypothetical protein
MFDAAYFRQKAADCRRAAHLGKRQPTPYLLDLAEEYDRQAAQHEARFAGDKPGALRS